MMHKLLRLLCAAVAIMLVLSALPLSAAPASDIPANMLDNVFLDALTYTGYKTETQKADGSIFKTYGSKTPSSVLSGIGYGTGASGLETVAANTKTGLAPNLESFKSGGLCCASYVSYVYYNFLPNIANRDVTAFPCPSNPRSPVAYNTAANYWVESGGARRINFTQSGSTFTPAEEIPLNTSSHSTFNQAGKSNIPKTAEFDSNSGGTKINTNRFGTNPPPKSGGSSPKPQGGKTVDKEKPTGKNSNAPKPKNERGRNSKSSAGFGGKQTPRRNKNNTFGAGARQGTVRHNPNPERFGKNGSPPVTEEKDIPNEAVKDNEQDRK